MFDFIETAAAIKVLYQYVKEEVDLLDFFELSAESYPHLYESSDQQWYMLNPKKLKKEHMIQPEALIVEESQKNSLLKAIIFIKTYSKDLPDSSSFLERLLYCKRILPPCIYETSEEKENIKGGPIHHLQKKKEVCEKILEDE